MKICFVYAYIFRNARCVYNKDFLLIRFQSSALALIPVDIYVIPRSFEKILYVCTVYPRYNKICLSSDYYLNFLVVWVLKETIMTVIYTILFVYPQKWSTNPNTNYTQYCRYPAYPTFPRTRPDRIYAYIKVSTKFTNFRTDILSAFISSNILCFFFLIFVDIAVRFHYLLQNKRVYWDINSYRHPRICIFIFQFMYTRSG